MTSIVDDCPHHCLLPDGQSTLYDPLPTFDEDLAGDVTPEELSLPPPPETLDENQGAGGSSLPATPAERPCTFCPNSLPLPPASCPTRATLVLDLDGTLIASEELNAANSTYLWSPNAGARTPDYEAMGRRVWLRPGVRDFLTAVRPHFEIVLFTAATQNWAAAAVEQLDPSAELFDVMLHRDHTTSDLMWDYVKDLSRLGRDLARVVIVDDNPLMFMYQPDNALHIGAYEASTAGGPDNVLPQVAELLINQVGARDAISTPLPFAFMSLGRRAEDVREILGPMASAKSCISSTVATAAAHEVAANPHDHVAEAAAPGADVVSTAVAAYDAGNYSAPPAVEGDYATGYSAPMDCKAEPAECDAVDGFCDGDGNAPGLCGEGCMKAEEEPKQEDQQHRQEGDEQHESAHAHSNEEHGDCSGADSALLVGVEKAFDWDSDSEGAETFDEHGAAAQLGADVEESCHRHRDWEQHRSRAGGDDAPAAAPPVGHLAEEVGEQEESDAAPSEEQSDHSSEDFEALMEDAIAEYDSDAYDGRYDGELGYDGACPADTATAVVSPPTATIAERQGACGALAAAGAATSMEEAAHIAAASDQARTGTAVTAPADTRALVCIPSNAGMVLATASPAMETHVEAADGVDCCGSASLTPAASIRHTAGDLEGILGSTADQILPAGDEAAFPSQVATGAEVESLQLQTRQLSLPTGMVFLTDLNPAFGAGGSSSEAEQAASCEADAGGSEPPVVVSLPAADVVHEVGHVGYKRVRSEADADADEPAARSSVARLECADTPGGSRLHLAGIGTQPTAASVEGCAAASGPGADESAFTTV